MKKIKVSLLVKGNIIASGNIRYQEKVGDKGNDMTLSISTFVHPDNPILDLSEAVVIEGDMRVSNMDTCHGFVVATGDIISGEHDDLLLGIM